MEHLPQCFFANGNVYDFILSVSPTNTGLAGVAVSRGKENGSSGSIRTSQVMNLIQIYILYFILS